MAREAVDWQEARARIEAVTARIRGTHRRSPEEVRRILAERAAAAARRPADAEDDERIEVLAFGLACEHYAIETRFVREVGSLRELTPVPGTPAFIAGVTSLRVRVLAVVDLRRFFDLPARGLTELDRILVVRKDEMEFGLLADVVEGVRNIAVRALQAGLPTLDGLRARFLRGVTGDAVAVLDGDHLLGAAELKVDGKVSR